LKTLALRMERHNANALEFAQWLERERKVARVYYPGLTSHPQHALAKAQMHEVGGGYGGMISVELKTVNNRFLDISLRLPGELQSLESDPARLRATLEYHILGVGRELDQLRNAKLPTLNGELLTASVTDDGLQLDHANTRGISLRCANGVIHPIDAVLFPGFKPTLSARAQEESAWSGRRRVQRPTPAVVAPTAAQEAAALFETPSKASGVA